MNELLPYARIMLAKLLLGRAIETGVALEYNEELRQWKRTKQADAATCLDPDVVIPVPALCNYSGKLKNDKPTGYGILTIAPPSYGFMTTYSGKWKDGRYHGKGTLETVNSSHTSTYSGHFKEGLKHGYGHETWLGGEYKGRYENDEMCGEPTELW